MLENYEGQNISSVTFKTRQNSEWLDVTGSELLANKKELVANVLIQSFTSRQ